MAPRSKRFGPATMSLLRIFLYLSGWMKTKQPIPRGTHRRRLSALVVCLVAVFAEAARSDDYWVMGSYRIRANAEAEQRRLAEALDRRVFLYRVDDLGVWRVSVSAADLPRQQLDRAGVEAWKTPLDLEAITELPSARRQGSRPRPPSDATFLAESETILQWCARMNARAVGEPRCNKEDMDRLRLLAETVAEQSRLLEARCRDTDSAAVQAICGDWRRQRAHAVP